MPLYRVRFEPMDIEADNPDKVLELLDDGARGCPDVRKIYLVDEDGFPIKP